MKLKVFGGICFSPISKKQVRTIVAASSRTKAVEALNEHGVRVTVSHMAGFWCVTGNKTELETALGSPGTVFETSLSGTKNLKPLLKKVNES